MVLRSLPSGNQFPGSMVWVYAVSQGVLKSRRLTDFLGQLPYFCFIEFVEFDAKSTILTHPAIIIANIFEYILCAKHMHSL